MSVLSIETKKFAELERIVTAADTDVLLIHDGTGVKTISVSNLKKDLKTLITTAQGTLDQITYSNAGARNAIYRGKLLGTSVTATQYAAISAGTFDDMYIGDYWTISGVNWRIAAFDYYYRCGDTDLTKHHVVLVPDSALYNATMNATNITTGGYVGSLMYTTNLDQAKTTINAAFSGHVMQHRQYLTNAVATAAPAGYQSGGAWFDSTVELMNEIMVYGNGVFSPVSNGTNVPANYTLGKTQLPLFALRPDLISNRITYWLRDVISAAYFARVSYNGGASCYGASLSSGVRPAFSIS